VSFVYCTLATETNALNGVTLYARGTNASGQTVLINTAPDGGVRIETYYQDGSLLSVTGIAAHAVQYLYGVDGDGPFTTEIKVTDSGGTNEWVKTSTDLLGRAYKTTYSAACLNSPRQPLHARCQRKTTGRRQRLASQARHKMVAPSGAVRFANRDLAYERFSREAKPHAFRRSQTRN